MNTYVYQNLILFHKLSITNETVSDYIFLSFIMTVLLDL